tara:strand:+ start:625 stop:831 length:207 start_codon:yes stop_codon:yes gene_type:complete
MTHEEMVAELIIRYPHRKKELEILDELLVFKDDKGVYGFVFDSCLITELYNTVAEYERHECDYEKVQS